ncbi:MAG: hypothetical protein R3E89_07400 [Thiolinea sp.]
MVGYSKDLPIERYYRDARIYRILTVPARFIAGYWPNPSSRAGHVHTTRLPHEGPVFMSAAEAVARFLIKPR